jgi:hypothetical protein
MSRRSVDVQHHKDLPTIPGEHPCDSKIRTSIHMSFPSRADEQTLYSELEEAYTRAAGDIEEFFTERDTARDAA